VADAVLPFVAATAAAAFVLGILLASGGGYPSKLLVMHRTLTLSGLGFIAACALLRAGGFKAGYRLALLGALGSISFGAHVGGSMTHGDGYLVRYAPDSIRRLAGYGVKATEAVAAQAVVVDESDDPRVFAEILQPILKEKCGECHGANKIKGGLRLDSFAAAMQGGEHPPTITPGKSGASEIMRRLLLPAQHKEHMPPDGKPVLSPAQVSLIRFWIDRGAKETTLASDGIVAADVANLLRARVGGAVAAAASQGACPTGDDPAAHTGPRLAFRDNVAPVLRARCGRCHGDSFAVVATNGKPGVDPVTLLARVSLPLADPKHMPPVEEAQPAPGELELIAYWVHHGASETMLESDLPGASQALPIAAATGPNWISALAKVKPEKE
jgi:cytochrome c553